MSIAAMPFCWVRKFETCPVSILPKAPVGVTVRFSKYTLELPLADGTTVPTSRVSEVIDPPTVIVLIESGTSVRLLLNAVPLALTTLRVPGP